MKALTPTLLTAVHYISYGLYISTDIQNLVGLIIRLIQLGLGLKCIIITDRH